MKVQATRAWLSARLTAAGFGVVALMACAGIAACSGSPSASLPKASPTRSATATPGGGSTSGDSPTATPTATTSPSPTAAATASPTPSPTVSPTPFPAQPPATGGGGTAGFQNAWLLWAGALAALAGAGSLAASVAYRRRATRNR
jgi:hypothetical protein